MNLRRLADYVVLAALVVAIIFAIRYFGLSEFSGRARVVDGDSLLVAGKQVRLYGIDAPELHQTCKLADGTTYRCGLSARDHLAQLADGQHVACTRIDIDKYQRDVSECTAGATNLNAEMVRSGWAVAYAYHTPAYVGQEQHARRAKRGLWRGTFIKPRIWRHMNPR